MSKNKTPKKNPYLRSFLNLFVFIFILVFLSTNFGPNYRSYYDYRQKTCYSNIRVIQGAVEMYNMDVTSPNEMNSLDMNKLLEGRYLREKPKIEEDICVYLGEDLSNDGQVYCEFHGGMVKAGNGNEDIYAKKKYRKEYEDRKLDIKGYFSSDSFGEFLFRLAFMPIYILSFYFGQLYFWYKSL